MSVQDWVVEAVHPYFRSGDRAALSSALDARTFEQFVVARNIQLIFVYQDTQDGSYKVVHDLPDAVKEAQFCVAVAKTRPVEISTNNVQETLQIHPLRTSPTSSLYHAIHDVFAPLLLRHSDSGLDEKLKRLLAELDAGLAMSLRDAARADDDENINGIMSLQDEWEFWERNAAPQARARVFLDGLRPIKAAFDSLSSVPISEMPDFLASLQDNLDDLWRVDSFLYPEGRMRHLLNLLTDQLVGYVQEQLLPFNVMIEPLDRIEPCIRAGISVCTDWASTTTSLTARIWPYYTLHPWNTPSFKHDDCHRLKERLCEILSLKATHGLIVELLQFDDQRELNIDDKLEAFGSVNALLTNRHSESRWKAAVARYYNDIERVEQRAALQLRSIFASLHGTPSQLVREFQRYAELVKRTSVAKHLELEREALVSQLLGALRAMRTEFHERVREAKESKGKNVPVTVHQIVWAQQSILKLDDIGNFVKECIGGAETYEAAAQELSHELHAYASEQFTRWASAVEAVAEDRSNPLATVATAGLLDLDLRDGRLHVRYNDELITFVREVRQLLALGFSIPAQLQRLADDAQRFYRHAVVLKQIAHFYNNIGQEMLPSQQAMLLDLALEFERLVRNSAAAANDGDGTYAGFSEPKGLDNYVARVQAAANKLTEANRKLRKYHELIRERVVGLMGVHLIRNQQQWKDGLAAVRGIINDVQENNLRPEDTLAWRVHWDYQLYKSLEYQYRTGLETLSQDLPEMKVDMIFKNQRLQYRPPFEEIRAKYYREIKKYISIPSSFRGLADNRIFEHMAEQSIDALGPVYERTEELFGNLNKVIEQFKDWLLLGSIDLDEYVTEALTCVPDFESAFKALKAKGREAEQLPTEIRIGCIVVSAAPVKATIDDHLQRLFDAMLAALRRSVTKIISEVDDFVRNGTQTLSNRPQTIAEVGEAYAQHAELSSAKGSIENHLADIEARNKLLKSVAGADVDSSDMQARWSKLEILLESHELMVKEQVDVLREQIKVRKQMFQADLDKFKVRWQQLQPKPNELQVPGAALKAVQYITERLVEISELRKAANSLSSDTVHFHTEHLDLSDLDALEHDISGTERSWKLLVDFEMELESLMREDWISFRNRVHTFEDLLNGWTEKLRGNSADAITAHIQRTIDLHRDAAPIFKFMRGDNWTAEHWAELYRIASIPPTTSISDLTFGHILTSKDAVLAQLNQVQELNRRAQGEIMIREALEELEIWAASATLNLTDYRDAADQQLQIIRDWKETLTQVGDNQSLLQSLKDSPYYDHFAEKAAGWEKKLITIDESLRNLNLIQRKWVYLEPIFNRGSLPNELHRFKRIDNDFRSILEHIERDTRVVLVLSYSGLKEIVLTLLDQLDRCQKALNEFLELKRSKFPRFYFIGDEDLLEILGQAKDPNVIQAHLKKLFAGVHEVVFDRDVKNISAIRSLVGETVPLRNQVEITNDVEDWLARLAEEMQHTLKRMMQDCLKVTDIFQYPLQILTLCEYVHFTANVEEALNSQDNLAGLQRDLQTRINEYTTFDFSVIEDPSERAVAHVKVKSLILDTIHFIDVLEQLRKEKITSVADWGWERQLKFYLDDLGECIIRMGRAQFAYTFEYQGNPPKLVHTPLTDKCYLTLTQALASGFGGNPFGPAGTGKTESVKALGVLFGRQVLVFNCDEGIDYQSMGRIFVGLIKCGAWGCFDEFNRLDEAVLSAVSQQIQLIQAALKSGARSVKLLEQDVDLDLNSGIFVTLNPAGKGYGGRQKLPDNLKQLFRSVAMTHPENELISEVILFAEGFRNARELGRKIVAIFTLCKQLMSKQQHYDWGLRPLKAVLGQAGQLLQDELRLAAVNPKREAVICAKALRLNTLSKLTFQDSQRFHSLLNDVFPDVPLEDVDFGQLTLAVEEAYDELGFVFIKAQAEKVYQLHQACRQRMGVVVVGPSGSGKSILWQLLGRAWQKLGLTLHKHIVNPKAIERSTLLGRLDPDTREWFDGVITHASRQAVKQSSNAYTWIICDGDVDPEWVESLNSVLDDNRLLTLPNGERIQFGPNVNFIFETHNLKFASPATVSRMGMIYLSDESLDVRALVSKWAKENGLDAGSPALSWIDELFYTALDAAAASDQHAVQVSKIGLARAALSHVRFSPTRTAFLYGLIRGFTAHMYPAGKSQFANETLAQAKEPSPNPKKVLDYFVDADGHLAMYQHKGVAARSEHEVDNIDCLPIVETTDITKYEDTLMPWLTTGEPCLLVGPEGSGKHTILRLCFSKLPGVTVVTIHCSAQTRSSHIIQRLTQACTSSQTTAGRILRPKDSDRLILYLKDVNLPKPDKYDTVELVQFLQQLLTYKGFYDAHLEWITVENVQIVATMNPSGALGKHQLSTRFTSIVNLCHISYQDLDHLQVVYQTFIGYVLEGRLPAHPVWSSAANRSRLVSSMMSIYGSLTKRFTRDMQPHYIFSPRDLSRWVVGLGRYDVGAPEADELLAAFTYEAARLFEDRLVDTKAKEMFRQDFWTVMHRDWEYRAESTDYIWTTISGQEAPRGKRLCRQSVADYKEEVLRTLTYYERDCGTLNVCLVPEVLMHCAHVEHALGQSGASVLLAGRPGMGRLATVHLVASILKLRVFTLNMGRNYDGKSFITDVKALLAIAGVQGERVICVLEDHHLVKPSFIECVNSLLSGGEIPGLYTPDEIEAILASLKEQYSQEGFRGTVLEYFTTRIQKMLHFALVFDCSAPDFGSICQANPAIYARCQMLWKTTFSSDTYFLLAEDYFVSRSSLAQLDRHKEIIGHMLKVHTGVGGVPRQFSDFLRNYERVYSEHFHTLTQKQQYLQGGLSKMAEAAAFVDRLSEEAETQEKELATKQREADTALKMITDSMVKASEQKKEMEDLSAKLAKEESSLTKRKAAIEVELAEVEPIVKKSKEAVGEIRPESLTEIRSLRAPPPAIRDVLEGVLRIMGILDMSWNSMKAFLGKRTVKDEILNFEARNVSRQARESVQELLREKRESFEETNIKRVSVAAAPLAMWVKANLQYAAILDRIAPLEADLVSLTTSLEASRRRLDDLQQALSEVDTKVVSLKDDFAAKTRDAEVLRLGLQKAQATMQSAQSLLGKLAGEGHRWQAQMKGTSDALAALPMDTLLGSAFVNYLGSAPEDARTVFSTEWSKMVGITEFSFRRLMASESEQLVWKSQGLPPDYLSVENAVIILNSTRCPLIIDPTGQAGRWLQTNLTANGKKPEIINHHDDKFPRSLELAVRFGKTLILQEVTHLEPFLYPLLRQEFHRMGPRITVSIGDRVVDYNENFRLFLLTRQPSFTVTPDAVGLVNVVNFTVTRAGLADQLLGLVLQHEKPELESQMIQLLQKEREMKIQLTELEEALLRELANSHGNILENESLINSLNETRDKSAIIEHSLDESRHLQAELDAERDKYALLSVFGSRVYFVLTKLCLVNHMYRFSLSSFLDLFGKALQEDDGSGSRREEADVRVADLMGRLQKLVYQWTARSLLKSHRYMFALYFTHELYPALFHANEWDHFGGEIVASDDAAQAVPSWVPRERLTAFQQLMAAAPSLAALMVSSESNTWDRWVRSPTPESEMPSNKLSGFQRVLLIQAVRPDRLLQAVGRFCCSALKLPDLSPLSASVDAICNETQPHQPVLFIITAGVDPTQEIAEAASRMLSSGTLHQIAMGQGQGERAVTVLREAAQQGGWVYLQNVHLVTNWLSTLEKVFSSLKLHESFRLWMTSEAHSKFPPNLLQNCVKVTVEAPPGIKKNLQRTYEAWSPDFVAKGSLLRAQALFTLAWFHAIVQERRTYIPQGWTKFYEFSTADLRSSTSLLNDICEGTAPRWKTFHGLLENAIYGGRIDDPQDALRLRTYLTSFFNEDAYAVGNRPTRKLAKGLSVPNSTDYSVHCATIAALPDVDDVTAFGLPANIDRVVQRNASSAVVSQLKGLRHADIEDRTFDLDQWTKTLSPLLQLWKKMISDTSLLQKITPEEITANPVISFLGLETVHASTLLRRIHSDLSSVSLLLRGSVLLTSDMAMLGTSLLRSETPQPWLEIWDGPGVPQVFLKESVQRAIAVENWFQKAKSGTLLNSNIRLVEVFHPITFLNAVRQQTSRKARQSMDALKLISRWSVNELPKDAVYLAIQGLWMQGCSFDGSRLSESHPDDPAYAQAPTCFVAWVLESSDDDSTTVSLPLYYTPSRDDKVGMIQVPCEGDGSKWILAGAAFFLSDA
ncbi:Cytoplasmic dynein 2 heavy chain 1 [Gaertneriomyces sp. JEL0708]|nr:Cytoplasmic dynein 2 heavy chain 1 [Gaertneriomyces sp. JEL0708]